MNVLGECACIFLYVWMSLERNTYTVPHVVNISISMAVLKFTSVDEMKQLVILKDLAYSDVTNILQEKNPDAKGISERSVRCSVPLIILENDQISVKKKSENNLFGSINSMTVKVFIILGNNRFYLL